jgi:pimeloyl-ACP methyl ester carboxylesterase
VGISDYEGSASFSFRIIPPPDTPAGIIEKDVLLPDIREYQPLDAWIGVPIVNYTDEWLVVDQLIGLFPEGLISNVSQVPEIPPFSMVKVPLHALTVDDVFGMRADAKEIEGYLYISGEGWDNKVPIKFRVRNAQETWRETFLSSIDGSVQKYAVRPPIPFEFDRKYALIISTHGAGVDCDGQVEAYSPKDWAYVVAPTNRRPFGFDWQDWGRLDFLEVLENAMSKLAIDENRVILTGHSMGGHGAWHIGVTHSDKFAAVCPIASWASHELYVPFTLRQSELFGPPEVKHILDCCVASDKTELLISNLSGVPVLAMHGDEDRVVAPTQPRLLIGELEKYGSDARLIEVPGAVHWWDNDTVREGSDAVDMKELIDWMQDKTRNTDPDWVSFVTYDLANSNSKNYIEILAQDRLYERTSVSASIAYGGFMEPGAAEKPTTNPYAVSISTQNVTALRFKPTERLLGLDFRAQIDGDFIPFVCSKEGHTFYRGADGHWTDKPPAEGIGRKFTGVTGPIKRAYYTPFLVVDMSNGTEPKCAEMAANIAVRWWYRANGFCQVKNWSELTDDDKQYFNLVIVATEKSLDPTLAEYLPFKFVKEEEREVTLEFIAEGIEKGGPIVTETQPGIEFGGRYFFGRNLAVQFVYPSPYDENKLIHVNMAQTEDALDTCAALTPLYSGSSLPDFVLGKRVDIARWGMAGAMALGFFDANWRFDDDLMYIGQGAERVKE